MRLLRGSLALAMVFAVLAGSPWPVLAKAGPGEADASARTAERFVAAINAADGAALNDMIDVDALGGRVLRNLDLNAVDRARYVASLRLQYAGLGHSVAVQMGAQHAKAMLVRSGPSATGGEFLARVTTTDGNGNDAHGYLQVMLDRDGRIVDWYDHALALSMSGQLAFSAAGMLTTGEVGKLLFGEAGDAVETAKLMQELATALTLGNMRLAHEVLMQMPASIQARREFATIRISLARSVSMEAYGKALAELASKHGDVDELQFVLIDHYLLGGKPALALTAIDRAAKLIGDDQVMDASRCHALLELERMAEALAACDRAIATDPAFETPRWTRVRLALKSQDAALAVESLTGVEQARKQKLDAAGLATNKAYAWLVTQPEFVSWAKQRGWSPPR